MMVGNHIIRHHRSDLVEPVIAQTDMRRERENLVGRPLSSVLQKKAQSPISGRFSE